MRRSALLLVVLVALLPAGCAWANRERRPVWDAFEENLVPQDDVAFYATLPLTVPLGFVAILTDVFIANPIMVFDDTAQQAGDLWRDVDWENEYYYQSAVAPLRGVGTVLYFVGRFLVNSFFDVPLPGDESEVAEPVPGGAGSPEEAALLQWIATLGDARALVFYVGAYTYPSEATDVLRQQAAAVLATGTAHGRASLWIVSMDVPGLVADPTGGLTDEDPVVRYLVLQYVPLERIPPDVAEALLRDPSPAVRERAARRFDRDS